MRNLHFIYLSIFALLILWGCNLFSPGTKAQDINGEPDALISYGQKMFRKSAYDEATKYYEAALKKDSTKSEAYFGLAKSQMRGMGTGPALILQILRTSLEDEKNSIPFINLPKDKQNNIYRSMGAIIKALDPLIERDTLTAWWELSRDVHNKKVTRSELHKDPKKADSLRASLENFEFHYGAYPDSKKGKQKFPLSDRKYKYARFSADYALASMAHTLLKLFDFNGDGYINSKDISINIEIDSNGMPRVDVEAIMEEATSNPAVAENLNSKIDELAGGTTNISGIISSFGGKLGLEEGDEENFFSEETKAAIDSQLNAFSDIALFYKIVDGFYNDGDGCIDEEIFDSVDND